MHSSTSVRYRPSQTVIQSLILESKCVDWWVFRATVETLRGVSGELVGMLEHRSVNICCLLATRFKGKSVRIYYGKAAQYKLLWIWNGKGFVGVGIFLAKKWVDKVTNISRVSDKMIANKVFVQRIIISLISDLTVYAPQCGLDSQKDDFYDSLINFIRKLGEK